MYNAEEETKENIDTTAQWHKGDMTNKFFVTFLQKDGWMSACLLTTPDNKGHMDFIRVVIKSAWWGLFFVLATGDVHYVLFVFFKSKAMVLVRGIPAKDQH